MRCEILKNTRDDLSISNLDGTFGALFIGLIVATALWGVSAVQTWFYFDNYPNDHVVLRALAGAVFLTDTTHQIVITHALYYYCIRHWGSVPHSQLVVSTLYLDVLLNGLTGLMVQLFFTYRIWKFRKSLWVTGVIVLLIGAEFVLSIAYYGLGFNLPTFHDLLRIKPVSLAINASTVAADVAITAAIVSFLNASKSGFSWSNSMINRLMLFSINTGLLTTLCAVASLIFYLALPNTLIYFGFYLTIGRLYSNSLLATLNARRGFAKGDSSGHESHSLTDRRLRGLRTFNTPQIQVEIETINHSSAVEDLGRKTESNTSGADEREDCGSAKNPSL